MVLPCSMCFNFQVAANSQNMNLVCLIIFDYYYSSEIQQPSHSWSGQPQFGGDCEAVYPSLYHIHSAGI